MIPHPQSTNSTARQEFELHLRLTESEARVLWALFCYGSDPILEKALQLGTHYMKSVPNYEHAMKTLGEKAYNNMGHELERIDATRKTFEDYGKPNHK